MREGKEFIIYLTCPLMHSSGSEVWHFNIEVYPTNECEFNGYLFTSLPEAITFYTENRLRSVYLVPPVSAAALVQPPGRT